MKILRVIWRMLVWITLVGNYGSDFSRQAQMVYRFLERQKRDGQHFTGAEKAAAFDERMKSIIVQWFNYIAQPGELRRIRKATWGIENIGRKKKRP